MALEEATTPAPLPWFGAQLWSRPAHTPRATRPNRGCRQQGTARQYVCSTVQVRRLKSFSGHIFRSGHTCFPARDMSGHLCFPRPTPLSRRRPSGCRSLCCASHDCCTLGLEPAQRACVLRSGSIVPLYSWSMLLPKKRWSRMYKPVHTRYIHMLYVDMCARVRAHGEKKSTLRGPQGRTDIKMRVGHSCFRRSGQGGAPPVFNGTDTNFLFGGLTCNQATPDRQEPGHTDNGTRT